MIEGLDFRNAYDYVWSRALLKAQVVKVRIARVTFYRKVNKKPNSNQDEVFLMIKDQVNQDQIFKAKIKAIKHQMDTMSYAC